MPMLTVVDDAMSHDDAPTEPEPFESSAAGDVRALEHLDDPSAKPVEYRGDLDALRSALASARSKREREGLLERAAVPLGHTGDPKALAFLAELIRERPGAWRVTGHAVRGLAAAGPPALPYLRELVEAGAKAPGLPSAFEQIGSPDDASLLLPFLGERGLRLRLNTVLTIDSLGGPAATEGLATAIRDRRYLIRAAALSGLRRACSDFEVIEILETARNDLPWYRLIARRNLRQWTRGIAAR
jgi:hypothetical protein